MSTVPQSGPANRWVAPLAGTGAQRSSSRGRSCSPTGCRHGTPAITGTSPGSASTSRSPALCAATGWAIARRAAWAPSAAAAAATLLLCDAWFDNVLASGLEEHVEAALEAALLEVPLALLCLWLARNRERTVTTVTAALDRRKG